MSTDASQAHVETTIEQNRLHRASAWSASAGAYTANLVDEGEDGAPHLHMSKGRKLVVARVLAALENKESPVVLDVAAAGGEPALSMAKGMPHATVHGTDFAEGMVDIIRKRGEEAGVSNLKAGVEDGELLSGFEDCTVDAVTCTWGLESMPDSAKAIGQFYRVLKPGGIAVIAAWDKDPDSIALKMFKVISMLEGAAEEPEAPPIDIQPLGGTDGVDLLRAAGFADVTATPVSIPFSIPPSLKLRELFLYMVKSTPMELALASMEKKERPNVREEACDLFESQVLEAIAQGRPPTGSGLPAKGTAAATADDGSARSDVQFSFCINAVIIQGRKTD